MQVIHQFGLVCVWKDKVSSTSKVLLWDGVSTELQLESRNWIDQNLERTVYGTNQESSPIQL